MTGPQSRPTLLRWVVLGWLALSGGLTGRAEEPDPASRVIVLANRDDAGSLRIAAHYAAARGVPAENIIALPMARAETIAWPEFVSTIWTPLLAELVQRRWIDAIPMKLTDALGRTKYSVFTHRIAYLVVCRGVPLKIRHDPALYVPARPFTDRQEMRTNAGSVDAELSLLPQTNYAINAMVPNPLFRDEKPIPAQIDKVVKVSRLDGPSEERALALVDQAIAAEKTGLLGRAYVDIGGQHPDGDVWLEAVARRLSALGFDTTVDRNRATFPATARFDAPVLYFGWYAGTANGPFTLPGFRFPPGAVALHIHSYSASTLRSDHDSWCGPLLARGVTATVGNVFEPYLHLTHQPDLLLRALARGETFGDAVYYALPSLSWQGVAIGDPLYQPFRVSLEEQWERRASLPARLGGYAAVRKLMSLEANGASLAAEEFARATQREQPTLALGLAWAQHVQAQEDVAGAADVLSFVAKLGEYRADELALAREAALILGAAGRSAEVVQVYRTIFQFAELPAGLKRAWLPEALLAAKAAKDRRQAAEWEQALERLSSESKK